MTNPKIDSKATCFFALPGGASPEYATGSVCHTQSESEEAVTLRFAEYQSGEILPIEIITQPQDGECLKGGGIGITENGTGERECAERPEEAFARMFANKQQTYHPLGTERASEVRGCKTTAKAVVVSSEKQRASVDFRGSTTPRKTGAAVAPGGDSSLSWDRDTDGTGSRVLKVFLERLSEKSAPSSRAATAKPRQATLLSSVERAPVLRGADGLADLAEMAEAIALFGETLNEPIGKTGRKLGGNDPHLARVVEIWPRLPRRVRDAITALVCHEVR